MTDSRSQFSSDLAWIWLAGAVALGVAFGLTKLFPTGLERAELALLDLRLHLLAGEALVARDETISARLVAIDRVPHEGRAFVPRCEGAVLAPDLDGVLRRVPLVFVCSEALWASPALVEVERALGARP